MPPKTENPDTFLVDYTSRLIVRHLLLAEDHLLEYSRDPSDQCLACLWWHLEKLIAYSSLECVKFEGLDAPFCQELSAWAVEVQGKMDGMSKEQSLEYAKQARDYRYRMAEMAPAPAGELAQYIRSNVPDDADLHIPAPFGWVGGKRQLSKKIVALIPPHKTYVEPFCGAASVFWAKEPSEVEVLNDLDPDLMRFYREIGKIDRCDVLALSDRFEEMKARQGDLEPCEFLSLLKCSFGDKRDAKAMPSDCKSNALMFHKRLSQYQKRVRGVKLHNEDWEGVINQYDAPDAFFYLDPPYHGTSRGYRFGEDQLARLADVLPRLKGKWLLSYDDHPDVRGAFSRFNIVPVASRYTVGGLSNDMRGRQLLIANYPLDGAKLGEASSFMGTAMARRVRYNRGDLDSVIAAAKRLKADHRLYIFATAYGYTIEHREPIGRQQYIYVDPDGSVDFVGSHILAEYIRSKEAIMAKRGLHYFGFENEDRSAFPGLPFGIMSDKEVYLLDHPSPNVGGAGMYREVSLTEFIQRGRREAKEAEMGNSMLSKDETEVIENRLKSFRQDMFKQRTLEDWQLHGEQMQRLWGEWDLPPASIPPEHYVLSMQWQVAPSRLTIRRLKQALDEDLNMDVATMTAKQLLDRYGYFEEATMGKGEVKHFTVTKETRDEWTFGKPLERILKDMSSRNPTAKLVMTTLRVDDTIWTWIYKDIGSTAGASISKGKYPYARPLPSDIYVYRTTIEKHYIPSSACHKGSVRAVKPQPDVLVYIGCLKKDRWDANTSTCSPNPTVLMTIVPNNDLYRGELDHLKLVHPEIKIHRKEKEVGVEPKLSDNGHEEKKELAEVIKAMDKAEGI